MGGRNEATLPALPIPPTTRRSKHWFARALRSLHKLKKQLLKDGIIRRISPASHGLTWRG